MQEKSDFGSASREIEREGKKKNRLKNLPWDLHSLGVNPKEGDDHGVAKIHNLLLYLYEDI